MSDKEPFDEKQGHGNHNDTVFGNDSDWLAEILPACVRQGRIAWTADSVKHRLGDGFPPETAIVAINHPKGDIALSVLLGVIEPQKRNELLSAYPECEGGEVEFVLEEIHEYAAGVEAVLSGSILDGKRSISFFDTRYAESKHLYKPGNAYRFLLSALAYDADVLENREIVYKDATATDIRRKMAIPPEFEKDGSVKPLVFDMTRMVALFQRSGAYPDDAEFQSPAYGIAEREAFGIPFYRIRIAIALDEQTGESVRIPLYARKDLFASTPKKNDPVRGHFWLQGRLCK